MKLIEEKEDLNSTLNRNLTMLNIEIKKIKVKNSKLTLNNEIASSKLIGSFPD